MSLGWVIFIGFIIFMIYVEYDDRRNKKEKIIQLKKDIDWYKREVKDKEQVISMYKERNRPYAIFRGLHDDI
ncbi:hypothetical protein [Sulfuricurvum sp.]|uniref:hypothetical protein n=1 Tax=Sulfuricurvum sp. TaxID=2025608 RepID=UPI00262D6A5A|nr:hypothetical protein [Sulfuricurvum sp.]MDD2267632.1 hypothetical protein [Sulfuricurvum sp.]MDD2784976.1 hypothetical protein [Sulfuricurvum sp.]